MKSPSKSKARVFFGVVAVLAIIAGLLFFVTQNKPVETQPDISSKGLSESTNAGVKGAGPHDEEVAEEDEGVGQEGAQRDVDVFGVVWNEEGEPVAGALVGASQGETGVKEKKASSVTLEDGTYALKGLRLNNPQPYKIVASADDYAPTASMPFFFDKAPKEIDITLSRGTSIRGRVTTTEGVAIEGATLSMFDVAKLSTSTLGTPRAETSASGEYAIPNVPPAEYRIRVQANYYSDKEENCLSPRKTQRI